MIILNTGAVPVRVAGRWLQPGETAEVDMTVASRLMAANPDVVEPGKEPTASVKLPGISEKGAFVAFAVAGSLPVATPAGLTENLSAAAEPEIIEPSTAVPVKRKK